MPVHVPPANQPAIQPPPQPAPAAPAPPPINPQTGDPDIPGTDARTPPLEKVQKAQNYADDLEKQATEAAKNGGKADEITKLDNASDYFKQATEEIAQNHPDLAPPVKDPIVPGTDANTSPVDKAQKAQDLSDELEKQAKDAKAKGKAPEEVKKLEKASDHFEKLTQEVADAHPELVPPGEPVAGPSNPVKGYKGKKWNVDTSKKLQSTVDNAAKNAEYWRKIDSQLKYGDGHLMSEIPTADWNDQFWQDGQRTHAFSDRPWNGRNPLTGNAVDADNTLGRMGLDGADEYAATSSALAGEDWGATKSAAQAAYKAGGGEALAKHLLKGSPWAGSMVADAWSAITGGEVAAMVGAAEVGTGVWETSAAAMAVEGTLEAIGIMASIGDLFGWIFLAMAMLKERDVELGELASNATMIVQ